MPFQYLDDIVLPRDPQSALQAATKQYVDNKTPAAIDAYTKAESDAKFVDVAGDTMTGALTVQPDLTVGTNAGTTRYLVLNGAAGNSRLVMAQTAGLARWVFGADYSTEGGSDTGSLFVINYFADAGGSPKGTALSISRTNGEVWVRQLLVSGQVKFSTGTPGAGKVWTSDSQGIGSWSTPASSGHVIRTAVNNGSVMPTQPILEFGADMMLADDPANTKTTVTQRFAISDRVIVDNTGLNLAVGDAVELGYIPGAGFLWADLVMDVVVRGIAWGGTAKGYMGVIATKTILDPGAATGEWVKVNPTWVDAKSGCDFDLEVSTDASYNFRFRIRRLAINQEGTYLFDAFWRTPDAAGSNAWSWTKAKQVAPAAPTKNADCALMPLTQTVADARYVEQTGDTMTGPLTVNYAPTGSFQAGLLVQTTNTNPAVLTISTPSGSIQQRVIRINTGTLPRWQLGCPGGNEPGSDAGSDLSLFRFSDAGSMNVTAVLAFSRATGQMTIGGPIRVSGLGTPVAGAALVSTNTLGDMAWTAGAVARKFAANIVGGAVSEVITHNLGTQDVSVTLVRTSSPFDGVLVDWEATTANTITLRYAVAPTAGQYRVVVMG